MERISVRSAKKEERSRAHWAGYVCVHERADTRGPVSRDARTYNHCDYLVLGIDYGFA